eukprot:gene7525-670_t
MLDGRLRVLSRGDVCEIHLEDAQGELFAMCPVPYGMRNAVVEPAVDSSRYFVLRVEDPGTKRHAFLGMGFNERSESFDFTEALLRHEKHVEREQAVKVMHGEGGTQPPPASAALSSRAGVQVARQEVQALYSHHGDLSLKEGQTMSSTSFPFLFGTPFRWSSNPFYSAPLHPQPGSTIVTQPFDPFATEATVPVPVAIFQGAPVQPSPVTGIASAPDAQK